MKKTLKTLLLILLTLIMCTLSFASCSNTVNPPQQNDEDVSSSIGNNDNEESSSIDTDLLWTTSKYNNGLMLVWEGGNSQHYFINKKGERAFDIPLTNEYSYASLYNCDYFLGKYFLLAEYDRTTQRKTSNVLLDETGKVVRPVDVGVTDFAIEFDISKDMLVDGFILAERTEATYLETITELVVLDNEMNELTNLSDVVEKNELKNYKYLAGFLYKDALAINLRTGETYTNLDNMFSKITLENKSDWWKWYSNWDGEYYYDIRLGESTPALSVEHLSATAYRHFEFDKGIAGIMFRTGESGASFKYFFSIINENGELLFEPVNISNNPTVCSYNGIYAVATTQHLYLFDKTGKIAELEHQEDFSISDVELTFSDGVIVLTLSTATQSNKSFSIYTTQLKPLFD